MKINRFIIHHNLYLIRILSNFQFNRFNVSQINRVSINETRDINKRLWIQVVLLLCRLRPQYTFSHTRKSAPPLIGMVGLAIALPPPSVHEIRLETDMFVTRINFDFRIAHCEPRWASWISINTSMEYNFATFHKISLYTFIISNFVFLFFFFFYRVSELLDYTADELTGKNLYTLCHGEDANRLRKSHIDREYIFIDN